MTSMITLFVVMGASLIAAPALTQQAAHDPGGQMHGSAKIKKPVSTDQVVHDAGGVKHGTPPKKSDDGKPGQPAASDGPGGAAGLKVKDSAQAEPSRKDQAEHDRDHKTSTKKSHHPKPDAARSP